MKILPPSLSPERAKVDDFYAARSRPVPPLPWPTIAPPLTLLAKVPKGALQTQRLWITQYGEPITEKSAYGAIVSATKRAFGRAINPHLFRDCAVTTVAIEDPKHIGIAAPILGHTDLRTTEAHYIQVQQISAGRKLQASLKTLRRKIQKETQ